jgi:predicted PurR-regulated permease PerM
MEQLTPLQRILVPSLIALLLLLIYLLQPILTPFLVGMGIAYLGDPIVDRLEPTVGRIGGVVIVFAGLFLIMTLGVLLLIPMLAAELGTLIKNIPNFFLWLQQTASPLLVEWFGIDPFDVNMGKIKQQISGNWTEVGSIVRRLLLEITASGYALFLSLTNLVLIPVVGFYLMRDWDLLVGYLRETLPRNIEPIVSELARECDEVLGAFLRGQMLVMLALGSIYSLGLVMIGLDLALIIGMMAGLASIVPYLGFLVGIVAATLAALFQYQDLLPLVYVVIVFGIGQMLEGMVLTPLLVGDRIGLHPVAVIFAILAGGQLFGFIGILLALPFAAVIMVFLRFIHDRYKDSDYYRALDEPDPSMSETDRKV